MSLIACQTGIPLRSTSSQPNQISSATLTHSPSNTLPNNSQNQQFFGIKSTSTSLKSTFLTNQRFVRTTTKPVKETRSFQVGSSDVNRRFILNLTNGPTGFNRVSSAMIKLNGKVIASSKEFNQQVAEISLPVSGIQAGNNTLEVELDSKPNISDTVPR